MPLTAELQARLAKRGLLKTTLKGNLALGNHVCTHNCTLAGSIMSVEGSLFYFLTLRQVYK